MTQETIERTFQVAAPARLNLRNICGSVDLRSGPEGAISVTAVKQTHTGDSERTKIEFTQEADGSVNIATRFPDGAWSWLFGSHPCCVDYFVKAPRACSLRVEGVSHTTVVEGFEGQFDFNSVSGELSLRDLTGPVRVRTVSGPVSAENLSGTLKLDSVSADAEFKQVKLASVEASTVSGRVDLQTALTEGPYRFRSVSGDVRLRVSPESRCLLELHSLSGEICTDFPLSRSSQSHGSQTAEVQGSGVKVCLHSVSGGLRLDCDGELPPAPPSNLAASADARREVLSRLEHGELTVEAALAELQGGRSA